MRKTAIFLIAILAQTAGLWASVQPVRVPCPEMTKAAGRDACDPCPMKDCCRLGPPAPAPAATLDAPAQVRQIAWFLPPVALSARLVIVASAGLLQPVFRPAIATGLPPPPIRVPLRV